MVRTPPRATPTMAEAAQAASAISRRPKSLQYTISSGVLLRIRPVAPLVIREASVWGSPPPVPTVFLPDRGREEPNPNDPDYLEALQEFQIAALNRVSDVLIVAGTDILDVPEDMDKPEDSDWVERLRAAGLEIDEHFINEHARRLIWLRLYAMTHTSDVEAVIARIIALSGVTEVDVQRAAAAFLRVA